MQSGSRIRVGERNNLHPCEKKKANKKVLLCECKRHTARHVASTCCGVPVWGTQTLSLPGT